MPAKYGSSSKKLADIHWYSKERHADEDVNLRHLICPDILGL